MNTEDTEKFLNMVFEAYRNGHSSLFHVYLNLREEQERAGKTNLPSYITVRSRFQVQKMIQSLKKRASDSTKRQGETPMERENFQPNTLHLLDALIATLNFRPKVECPPELRERLSQLQIAIGAYFCAGPQGYDDCNWNCRYVGTEKCNYKCRYSCAGPQGIPGTEAAGAFDSTDENETDLTAQDLRRELVALRKKVQKFCRRHNGDIYDLFHILRSFCEEEAELRREESARRANVLSKAPERSE